MTDTPKWWELPWTIIDFETTGTDVETDRAVQVAAVEIIPDEGVTNSLCHIIDPGVEIPEAAAAIHKITTERARAEGVEPAHVIKAVAELVESAWREGRPVIAFNAPFDLTLLDRELRRHHGRGLDVSGALVLDPLLIDRVCDTYRKSGKEGRTLGALAAHYGVRQDVAHDALADVLTTARVLWRQPRIKATEAPGSYGRKRKLDYSPLRVLSLPELHAWQVAGCAAWAAHLQDYYRTKANPRQPGAVVDGSWPFRPARSEVTA